MRIGIDARLAFGDPTGLGSYSRRLVEALGRQDPGNEYLLYVDRPVEGELPGPNFRLRVVPGRNRMLWINWRLPPVLRRDRVDLFHAIANFEVPFAFGGLKLATAHDLVPLQLPDTVPARHRWLFRFLMPRALDDADRVIAVSRHTAEELTGILGTDRERVMVVPNWCDEEFRPAAEEEEPEDRRIVQEAGLGESYLLFVGVLEPKKNLDRLLGAFARIAAEHADVSLGLVGAPGWFTEHLRQRASALGIAERVRFVGFVPRAHLISLIRGARALVFPSLTEGFGLPVLEAMSCGTPVVTSRAGALPEVAGDAALYVDAEDEAALARAMERVVDDRQLAEDMRRKGLDRAADFSGPAAARRFVDLYLDLFNRVPEEVRA